MTIQSIINQSLYECHLKEAQVNATQLLGWFNLIRRDVARTIISDVNENFFFQIWTTDLVAGSENGEYKFPSVTANSRAMTKLIGLSVKTASDKKFIKATEVDITNMGADWDNILSQQAKTSPVYFIADNSVFLAPAYKAEDLITPTNNKQLKLYGIAKVEDLALNAPEADILIPSDYHPLIATGMQYHIYKSRGKINEAKSIQNDYLNEKMAMVDKLTNRDLSSFSASTPDDTALQY